MPRRRCVGCGRVAPKPELLRIAAVVGDGVPARRAVQDRDGTLPGRGAYLCRSNDSDTPVADCLAQAMRRGGIARALRSAVTLDPKLVESPGGGEAGRSPAGRNGDPRRRRVSPGLGRVPLSSIEP